MLVAIYDVNKSAGEIRLIEFSEALKCVMEGQSKFLGQDLIPAESLNLLFNVSPPKETPEVAGPN